VLAHDNDERTARKRATIVTEKERNKNKKREKKTTTPSFNSIQVPDHRLSPSKSSP
jgi:hypothetical protein